MEADLQSVLSFLGHSLGAGLVSIFAFILFAPSKIGERYISHHFERVLANIKHANDEQIISLKKDMDYLKDRGVRSNEREFSAIISVWEKFVESFIGTKRCIADFSSFPDLSKLSEDQVREFLEETELSPQQRKHVLDSDDRNTAFSRTLRLRNISSVGQNISDANFLLKSQGIFIPETLSEEFKKAIQTIWDVQVENYDRTPRKTVHFSAIL